MRIKNRIFEHRLKVIGTNLRAIRIARKEPIMMVAAAIDISGSCLEAIERGGYDMDLALLFRLCQYYSVKIGGVFLEGYQYPEI